MKKINWKLVVKKFNLQYVDYIYYMILFLLVFAGLSLLFYPQIQKQMIKSTISRYNVGSFSVTELAENQRTSEYVSIPEDIQIPNVETVIQNLNQANRGDVLGGIYIPSVNIDLPILNGVNQANLLAGVGVMKENQVMGEGNYCLAGHHMKDPALLFGPLSNISIGDLIYLTDNQYLYTYQTDGTKIVHQTMVEVLEDGETATVTLITCNLSGINTDQRLVVTGKLIGIDSLMDDSEVNSVLTSMDQTIRLATDETTDLETEIAGESYMADFLAYQETMTQVRTIPPALFFIFFAAISLLIVWLCHMLVKRT